VRNFQTVEDSEDRGSVGKQLVLRTASTWQLLVKAPSWLQWDKLSGANLQLARKSTQLPKCLLILKGPVRIFLGGPDSLSHSSVLHSSLIFPVFSKLWYAFVQLQAMVVLSSSWLLNMERLVIRKWITKEDFDHWRKLAEKRLRSLLTNSRQAKRSRTLNND